MCVGGGGLSPLEKCYNGRIVIGGNDVVPFNCHNPLNDLRTSCLLPSPAIYGLLVCIFQFSVLQVGR